MYDTGNLFFFLLSLPTKVFKCPSERDGRWGGFIFGKNFIGCFHLSEHVDHLEIFPLGKTRKLLGWGVPTLPPLFFWQKIKLFPVFLMKASLIQSHYSGTISRKVL